MQTEPKPLRDAAIDALKTIFDPEIPVSIWELGLIYEVNVKDADVNVVFTLTAPACPAAESLPAEMEQKIQALPGVGRVDLTLTFDPTWTQDMMSDEAKLELGML
jgi:FeS assembly SUF system protein